MSRQRPPANHAERLAIVADAAEVTRWLTTAPHTISHLVAAIDARIDDGLAAATYDGDGSRSSDESSTVERAALRRSDQAHDDARTLDADLVALAQITARIKDRIRRYPIATQEPRPGKDPCPSTRWCRDHWEAGYRVRSTKGRPHCAHCAKHRDRTGTSIPPIVLAAAEATRTNHADHRIDWGHHSVARAWTQIGGPPGANAAPAPPPPTTSTNTIRASGYDVG